MGAGVNFQSVGAGLFCHRSSIGIGIDTKFDVILAQHMGGIVVRPDHWHRRRRPNRAEMSELHNSHRATGVHFGIKLLQVCGKGGVLVGCPV